MAAEGAGRGGGVAIHWFRKGLRLHDNPALLAAAASERLVPLFVLDPAFADPAKVGAVRYRFLLEALSDLDSSLRTLDSRLFVARGHPVEVVPRIAKLVGASRITFEAEQTEPFGKARDAAVRHSMETMGLDVLEMPTHTLHDQNVLARLSNGKPVTAYRSFEAMLRRAPPVENPVEAPSALPPAPASMLTSDDMTVPTLEELGYPAVRHHSKYPGGESTGLKRLHDTVTLRPRWVREFSKPKTKPNSLDPDTTVLSPYLKFGCVSARTAWHAVQKATKTGPSTQPPVSLAGQLLWREFYYACATVTPNFDKTVGNSICRQIPWRREDAEFRDLLQAWENGRTGYPFIDAIMNQLREEGWIHHLARHAAACFLTRGDMWISWTHGARIFDKYLVDADWSLNNGNWMWLSASCFFYQYFRVYSPIAFGKKTDKDGVYIRKWVPALRKMPARYIYEPWTAPTAVQKSAECIVGVDYPNRVLDHNSAVKTNMAKMKAAYDLHNGIVRPTQRATAARPSKKSAKPKERTVIEMFAVKRNHNQPGGGRAKRARGERC